MFTKNFRADFLKMKGTPVTLAHILIPVIASGLFFLYYSFSAWNENTKIIAFYQTVGAGFPVLIGIFTAGMMEQEQNAGAFHHLFTLPQKTAAFWSKVLLLLVFSLFSLLLTAVLFGFGCTENTGICIMAALVMWCSSIPLYIWQMILAFQFGKGVSIGAGILSGLVSALMLTGLGKYIWKYIFVSWTGRIPYTYLKLVSGRAGAGNEWEAVIPFWGIFTVISMIYYLLWAFRWEGIKISE